MKRENELKECFLALVLLVICVIFGLFVSCKKTELIDVTPDNIIKCAGCPIKHTARVDSVIIKK